MATRENSAKKTSAVKSNKSAKQVKNCKKTNLKTEDATAINNTKNTNENTRLEFGDTLTVVDVDKWHKSLIKAVNIGAVVSLDAGDLRQIDCSGIQLLAVFAKEARTQNLIFEWCAASDVLYEAANQSGLSGLLQLNEPGVATI